MYRLKGKEFKNIDVNFLFADGGIGDAICRLPVLKYIEKHYKHITPYVWVPDYFYDVATHFFPKSGRIKIKKYSEAIKEYNKTLASAKTECDQYSNMASHLVDQAFHILLNKDVEIEHKNYLQLDLNKINISKFELPEKYVVVTTGFTADVREMKPITVNSIVDYIIKRGYTPVFLGSKIAKTGIAEINKDKPDIIGHFNKEIDYSKGIDLIDKTNLLQAGKIIAGAKAIVGLDNGLLHIAGMTDVPIVCGYTTVNPKDRLPYRHDELGWNCFPVVPDESVKCRFCQTNFNFVYDHDFRKCYYVEKSYDTVIRCVDNLSALKFINQLEKVL